MNAKNPANRKLAVASNIPNDKHQYLLKADSSYRSGENYRLVGQFKSAESYYRRALQSYQRSQDRFGLIQSQLRLGDVLRQQEQFSQAAHFYSRSQGLSVTASTFSHLLLDSKIGLALCDRAQGNYERSIRQFSSLLQVYSSRSDREAQAFCHWARGTTFRFAGKLSAAEADLKKAVALYKTFQDQRGLAYALAGYGGTMRMRNQHLTSQKAYQQANAIFVRLKDQFGLAYSYCGIGNSFRMMGDLIRARHFSLRALKIYTTLKQKGPRAFVLWSLAQIDLVEGNEFTAEQKLMQARKLFLAVQDQRGLVYCELGEAERARLRNDSSTEKRSRKANAMAERFNLALEKVHAERIQLLSRFAQKKINSYRKLRLKVNSGYARCGVIVKNQLPYLSLP